MELMTDQEVRIAADGIDTLVTSAVGGKFHKWEKEPLIRSLYQVARERTPGQAPLSYHAAKGLKEHVKPGDVVLMVTGWYLPHFMSGETDGPPGTAGLARAVDLGLGATPVIMTEPKLVEIVEASCRAAGLRVYSRAEAMKIPRRVVVESPLHPYMDVEQSVAKINQILDELKPAAVIAVEKGSRSKSDIYHSLWGIDITPLTGKYDRLVEEAKRRGIFTIGIGDGGNEIGLGGIHDAIEKYLPVGATCHCPCGKGVAATTVTDSMIVAFVSNWGAYGIEAALAMMLGRVDVMHSVEDEIRILRAAAEAGAIASPYGYSGVAVVDQIPEKINANIVEMLRYMVQAYLVETEQRKWYQETAKRQGDMSAWIRDEYAAWTGK